MIGDWLVKHGSKGEKRGAVYFAKDLIAGLGMDIYPGVGKDSLNADAFFAIAQDSSSDFYASGGDKPMGYLGEGFTRKKVAEYARQIDKDNDIGKRLFGGKSNDYDNYIKSLRNTILRKDAEKNKKDFVVDTEVVRHRSSKSAALATDI